MTKTSGHHSKAPVARKKSASKTNRKKQTLVKVVVLEDIGKWVRPEKASKHKISASPAFPDITFEIQTTQPGPYEWRWSIQWGAQVSGLRESAPRGKLVRTFTASGQAQTSAPSWKADLGEILGGTLTIEVTAGSERFKRSVFVVGTNPSKAEVEAHIATIPDLKGFAALLEQESRCKNFINADGEPVVAFDKGFGMTQITNPAPSYVQVWDWKQNISAGSSLYKSYQKEAKRLLDKHPPYTDEMLINETYARWNGGGYYTWDAKAKAWARKENILCDSATGNMGWNMDNAANSGKAETDLHERDKGVYKDGKSGQSKDHAWKYSGICYADHVQQGNR